MPSIERESAVPKLVGGTVVSLREPCSQEEKNAKASLGYVVGTCKLGELNIDILVQQLISIFPMTG